MSNLKAALEERATPFEDKCEAVSAKEMLALLWPVIEKTEWIAARVHKYECSGDNHSFPCMEHQDALSALRKELGL